MFGASEMGIRTMNQLGKDIVYAFCDNYKAGRIIEEKPLIDVDSLKKISRVRLSENLA